MPVFLVNERTRAPIATEVEVAETRADRRRGLLGRDSLWRIAAAAKAHSVVELAAGSLRRHAVTVGDRLYVRANG
jgi:uncharacterized membrane protein (UPF0127 family)